MSSFNKVILLGNLTRDPESRTLSSGTKVCTLSLATNRKFRTADGEEKEEVTFCEVDAFGKRGEVLQQYLHKGSPIHIEGRLRLQMWETNDGQKRSKLTVVLENFQFLNDPKRSDRSA